MSFTKNDKSNTSSHLALDIFPQESLGVAGTATPLPLSRVLPSSELPAQQQGGNVWDISSKLPGFVAAGIFDENGLNIDGYSTRPEFNIDQAAGSFIMLIQEANMAGSFMELGASQEIQIDYDQMIIILRSLRPAPQALILGFAVLKGTPLGRIRLALDQLERVLLPKLALQK